MITQSLPSKFDQYILKDGSENEKKSLKEALDVIFRNLTDNTAPLASIQGACTLGQKDHIVTHEKLDGWIIKGTRSDVEEIDKDQNIYRVRRAARLQNVINKYDYQDSFEIPKKYLYEHNGNWYVIAQKLNLVLKQGTSSSANPIRLTFKESQMILRLIYEGKLQDINEDNIWRTQGGKIALIDTEPFNRAMAKSIKGSFWKRLIFPGDKAQSYKGVMEAARFFTFLQKHSQINNQDLNSLEQIQNKYHLNFLAALVAKAVIPFFLSIGIIIVGVTTLNPVLTIVGFTSCTLSTMNTALKIAQIVIFLSAVIFYRTEEGRNELY